MPIVLPEYDENFWALGALPLAVFLELVLGQKKRWPRSFRAIDWLIRIAERGLRVEVSKRGGNRRIEFAAGMILTIVIVGLVASVIWLATDLLDRLIGPSTLMGRAILIYWGLSLRSLGDLTLRVWKAPSLTAARHDLAMIEGGDGSLLGGLEIHRSCLEAIGEHASDAIIAPLFWLAVAGPAGLWAYRAVGALDRMVGSRTTAQPELPAALGATRWPDGFPSRPLDLAPFLPLRGACGRGRGRGAPGWLARRTQVSDAERRLGLRRAGRSPRNSTRAGG